MPANTTSLKSTQQSFHEPGSSSKEDLSELQLALVNLISQIIDGTNVIKVHKQTIEDNPSFDVYALFQYLDLEQKGHLSVKNIQQYINRTYSMQGLDSLAYMDVKFLHSLFRPETLNKITFAEFAEFLLTKKSNALAKAQQNTRVQSYDEGLPLSLEQDFVSLLKAVYHENHKTDQCISAIKQKAQIFSEQKNPARTLELLAEWLLRSAVCYRRHFKGMDSYDDLNLDSETAEKLLFHFGKFYSEEEIKIALGVLGNGRIITPDSLTEFLHDDVIQIDATATWTEYDLPKSAEKNRALGRAIR